MIKVEAVFDDIINFPLLPLRSLTSEYEGMGKGGAVIRKSTPTVVNYKGGTIGRVLTLVAFSHIGTTIFHLVLGTYSNTYYGYWGGSKAAQFLLSFLLFLTSFLICTGIHFVCFRFVSGKGNLGAHAYLSGLLSTFGVSLLLLWAVVTLYLTRTKWLDAAVMIVGGLYLVYLLFKPLQVLHGLSIGRGLVGFLFSIVASVPFFIVRFLMYRFFEQLEKLAASDWQMIMCISGCAFLDIFILFYMWQQQQLAGQFTEYVPLAASTGELSKINWLLLVLGIISTVAFVFSMLGYTVNQKDEQNTMLNGLRVEQFAIIKPETASNLTQVSQMDIGKWIRMINVKRGEYIKKGTPRYLDGSVALSSPNGKLEVRADHYSISLRFRQEYWQRLWVSSKERSGSALYYEVHSMTFNADSTMLAAVIRDTIRVWDVAVCPQWGCGQAIQTLPSSARDIAFNPDSSIIASVHNDDVRLWDIETGELVGRVPVYQASSVVFSYDGKLLAVWDKDGIISLWAMTVVRSDGTKAVELEHITFPIAVGLTLLIGLFLIALGILEKHKIRG